MRPIVRTALVAVFLARATTTAPPPRFDDADLQGLIGRLESDEWTDDDFVDQRQDAVGRRSVARIGVRRARIVGRARPCPDDRW